METPSTSSSTCPVSTRTRSTSTSNATLSPSGPNARPWASDAERIAAERPTGVFSRQLILGDNLDTDHIAANYQNGVLRLEVPVAEKAKPRKITINAADDHKVINA